MKDQVLDLSREEVIKKITDPETYVQMAMVQIHQNPSSADPVVFHAILYEAVTAAMNVWAHNGHLLYLSKDKTFNCVCCHKVFKKEKEIPKSKICTGAR
jgi:hypothetical protein